MKLASETASLGRLLETESSGVTMSNRGPTTVQPRSNHGPSTVQARSNRWQACKAIAFKLASVPGMRSAHLSQCKTQKCNRPRVRREAGCLYIKQQLDTFITCHQMTIPTIYIVRSEVVLTDSRLGLLRARA